MDSTSDTAFEPVKPDKFQELKIHQSSGESRMGKSGIWTMGNARNRPASSQMHELENKIRISEEAEAYLEVGKRFDVLSG